MVAAAAVAADPAAVPAPRKVVLLGDSITAGPMSGPAGASFAEVLADLLADGYDVVNIGCGGSTSLDWTISQGSILCGNFVYPNLFEGRAVPNLPAPFVVVMLGTNDATGFLEPRPVPPRSYGRAMAEIVNNLTAHGAGQVVVMTPPPRCPTASREERIRMLAYRAIVLGACGLYPGTACGPDVFTLLNPETSFESCDVHPNADGHAAIGAALAEVILELSEASGAPGG